MPRYDKVKHPERDAEIKEYRDAHPDFSMREIAEDLNHKWEMERDTEMAKYQDEHPELSLTQVVDYFKEKPLQQISQGRVWQIVTNWQPKKKEKE
jgi:DNA-binding transcriptional regulator WhiA